MGGVTEQIYLESPIWVQQCVVAAYGWWWHRRRFSHHFSSLVAALKEREHWTAEQFRAYQAAQLSKVLAAAWRSPYYREAGHSIRRTRGYGPFRRVA